MITLALANRLLDSALRPGPIYVSLHTGNPGEVGAAEVVGEEYARQPVTFGVASDRATANLDRGEFRELPSTTVAFVGLWDAPTGGAFLWSSDRIAPPVVVPANGIVRLEPGDLTIKMLVP